MTSRGRSLRVDIAGDASKLQRELAQAQRAVKEAERDLARMGQTQDGVARSGDRLGQSLSRQERVVGHLQQNWRAYAAGLTAAAAAGGAALYASKQLVDAASNEAEAQNKVSVIFADQAGVIEDWAGRASTSIGLSRAAAFEAAGTFGNMFDQLGFGGEQVTAMSTSITDLAADFASFHNADITQVIQAQTAAFRGEYDALQRFVPTINAAAVAEQAMEMGLADTTKELTAQDKALATYRIIMDQAGQAAGDFERTSDGVANQQRILDAQIDDLQATIGKHLIPAYGDALKAVNEWLEAGGEEQIMAMVGALDEATAGMRDFAGEVWGAAAAAVSLWQQLNGALTLWESKDPDSAGFDLSPSGFLDAMVTAPGNVLKVPGLLRDAAGQALGTMNDSFTDEQIAFYQQRPDQFSPMAANAIEAILANRQRASLGGITEAETGGWDGRPLNNTPPPDQFQKGEMRSAIPSQLNNSPAQWRLEQARLAAEERRRASRSGGGGGSSSRTPEELAIEEAAKAAEKAAEDATRDFFAALEDVTRDHQRQLADAYFAGGVEQVEVVKAQQAEMLAEVTAKANELRLALGIDLADAMVLARDSIEAVAEASRLAAEAERELADQRLAASVQGISRILGTGASGFTHTTATGERIWVGDSDKNPYGGSVPSVSIGDFNRSGGLFGSASLDVPIGGMRPYDGDFRQTGPTSGQYGITNYGEINVNADQVDAESLMRLQDRMVE